MGSKVRLGLDAKRAFCNYRGLGNYSRLLIESLARWASSDLELVLLTPEISLREFSDWMTPQCQRVMPKGIKRIAPELWRGWAQVKEWRGLDLSIYHGLSHDLPMATLSTAPEVKTIVTIHDLIFLRYPELYPPWDRWTYLRKVKHSCTVADSVIAISQQTKQDLIDLLHVPEEKITILYQAIHPRYYKREQPQGGLVTKDSSVESAKGSVPKNPYFLFVGAFEERKNVKRLISAFVAIANEIEEDLVLIGKGPQDVELRDMVRAYSLQDRVHFYNNLQSEELPEFYQGATALVYPSIFEGFGLPLVEALMSETLVITSQGSCFPEAAGPGAFYVDPLRTDEIAAATSKVAGLDKAERKRRIDLGLQHSQQFHWKFTAGQLANHYQLLLNKKREG